jgi:hypothetical protein
MLTPGAGRRLIHFKIKQGLSYGDWYCDFFPPTEMLWFRKK